MGAKPIHLDLETLEGAGGYAREMTEDRAAKQRELLTPYIADADALQADIALIRHRGFAFDDEERTLGMRCVAASIVNSYGEAVAGVSVSGPTNRMTDAAVDRIGGMVATAAERISADLGSGRGGR